MPDNLNFKTVNDLLFKMRTKTEYSSSATMPIPLYEEIIAFLESISVKALNQLNNKDSEAENAQK